MTIDTIVTDLDDTLLDESGKISDYTLKVLKRCIEKGIRVIPASGRMVTSMRPLVSLLGTGLPYISGNGAELINADHSIMDTLLIDRNTAEEICKFLQGYDFYIQYYQGDYFYYAKDCEASRLYRQATGMQGKEVGDILSFLTFDVPKILAIHEPDEVMRVLPLIHRHFEGRVEFTVSKPHFIEVQPLGASKGEALLRLQKKLGFDLGKTIAFGDSLNDTSMLEIAGVSVAMGNAREEVKRIADYTCLSNSEDGLARFVEEHVLMQRRMKFDKA